MKHLIGSIITFVFGLLISLVYIPSSFAATSNEVIYAGNFGNGLLRRYTTGGIDLGNFSSTVVTQAIGIVTDTNNNIYVASASGNNVRRFSPSGVDLGIFASAGISSPRTLLFDTSGNLYVANVGNNTVRRFSPTGVDMGNFISNGLANPTGMAFDEAGNLYVVNYDLNQVKKFSTNGTYLGVAISNGLNQPVGIIVIPQAEGGGFYVANDFAGTLIRYNATGSIVTTLNNGTLGRLGYLARDSSKNLYVTRLTGNAVRKFSSTDQDLGDFAITGLNIPLAIVIGQSTIPGSLNDGLVANYSFNGNANDATANGNNGSISNATLIPDRFGTANSAFTFNGSNAQIVVNDNAALRSLGSNYTFNIWANFASLPNRDMFLLCKSFGGGDVKKWMLWQHVNAPLGIGANIYRTSEGGMWSYNFPFVTNRWYMITFSSSGNSSSIAVNGQVVSVQAGNFLLPDTTGIKLTIGGTEPNSGSFWFNGALDEVRIYNRALSSDEIAQLYSVESISPCEANVAALQAQLAQANVTNALLQSQLSVANNANAALQTQIAALQVVNTSQQTELIVASNTIVTLQTQLDGANSVISNLQASIASVEAANANLQTQLTTANAMNQQLQLQITSITQALIHLEDTFADTFQDPGFFIEGATLELQVSNLVSAIESLNNGQQLALKRILSGKKPKSGL